MRAFSSCKMLAAIVTNFFSPRGESSLALTFKLERNVGVRFIAVFARIHIQKSVGAVD